MIDRKELLASALRDAAIKAQEEQDQAKQVERIAAAVREKLTHVHASDDDLVCPNCGYKGSESDFEPDDDESDGFSTDPETSETGDSDDVDELDAKGKSRVVAELLKNRRIR